MQTTIARPITRSAMTIVMRRDMLGWVGASHFELEPLADDELGVFALLRCTDTVYLRSGVEVPSPTFLVTSPGFLWPSYQIQLHEEFAEALDLVTADDAALLAIVTQREPLERSTVNLFSPVVVNRHTGIADQYVPVVSEDEAGWRLRTPIPAHLVDGGREDGETSC